MTSELYDSDYFLRGQATGKSLYTDYHWMPTLTIPMVESMVQHLSIADEDSILDFGCARGYVVKAFRHLGYNARGIDVSKWAIENADEEIAPYVRLIDSDQVPRHDWIIAKDVLEHVYFVQRVIDCIMESATRGVFAVVPLSRFNRGLHYIIPEYDADVTHCQRHSLAGWVQMFLKPGWTVEASYRVVGIKDNWASKPEWELGNGFITCRRMRD